MSVTIVVSPNLQDGGKAPIQVDEMLPPLFKCPKSPRSMIPTPNVEEKACALNIEQLAKELKLLKDEIILKKEKVRKLRKYKKKKHGKKHW